MRVRFRQFINNYPFPWLEQEAAPAVGMPAAPEKPGGSETHHNVKGYVQHEFDIDDEDFESAEETQLTAYQPIKFASDGSRSGPAAGWPYIVGEPMHAYVEKVAPGVNKVTFMVTLANRRKLYKPYRPGEKPVQYEGPVKDEVLYLKDRDLEEIRAGAYKPLLGAQAGMSPPGPGTGPAPPGTGAEGMLGGNNSLTLY